MLELLVEFIETNSRRQDVRPWGNSNSFDISLLSNAYQRIGIRTPWSPFKERDFRTIRNWYPQVVYDTDEKGDGAHDALTDAIFQANHLFRIKRALRDARK